MRTKRRGTSKQQRGTTPFFIPATNFLQILGQGFISHPENQTLRKKLSTSHYSPPQFYQHLLGLFYRIFFLLLLEERKLLFTATTNISMQQEYWEKFSLFQLATLAEKYHQKRLLEFEENIWEQQQSIFEKLKEKAKLPSLNHFLFSCEAIGEFRGSKVKNEDFLTAFYLLIFEESGKRRSFKNIEAQKLGSLHESLLELQPIIKKNEFRFVATAGHRRKTSGSYYTPSTFIESLLDSALEPVLATAIKSSTPTAQILKLRVCDPSCGIGYFLNGAAERLAKALIRAKDQEEKKEKEYQEALAEVINNCIYGVDINPLTVALCKINLWLAIGKAETTFSLLDKNIKCGNSILGVTPNLLQKDFIKDSLAKLGKTVTGFESFTEKEKANFLCCQFLQGELSTKRKKDVDNFSREKVKQLSKQHQFFHWPIEFPDIFISTNSGWLGGFDALLGNPPWERIKIQEREWFAAYYPEIAATSNAAERQRRIAQLKAKEPSTYQKFLRAKQKAEAESSFIRRSGTYPFCGRGDINTYPIFTELSLSLLREKGRIGYIVPSGIATDLTTRSFFQKLIESHLISFYHFDNRAKYFLNVGGMITFCLITLTSSRPESEAADFVFFAKNLKEIKEKKHLFQLTGQDLALLNPNTKTCVVFRSKTDSMLIKAIYQKVPILSREGAANEWQIRLVNMFHMTNDASHFLPQKVKEGKKLSLYEAKMFHLYNHRFAEYSKTAPIRLKSIKLSNLKKLDYKVTPRYQVEKTEVERRLKNKWAKPWFLGIRSICRSTDERTVIASILPYSGVGNSVSLLFFSPACSTLACLLLASLSCYVIDFIARLKIGGPNLNFFILKQLPILPPSIYQQPCPWEPERSISSWIQQRVLELTYTSWELKDFAQDCGYSGEPFLFEEERRFELNCELEAAYFYLYDIKEEDIAYIMETFPMVKRKEMKQYQKYLSKEKIIKKYQQFCDAKICQESLRKKVEQEE